MWRRIPTILALAIYGVCIHAPEVIADTVCAAPVPKIKKADVPPVVHSQVGDSSAGVAGSLKMVNIGKRQQYSGAMRSTFDTDIISPKSATFSADGTLLYINSLEGCRTVVYDAATLEKLHVVDYKFDSATGHLWAAPSGFYVFTHYPNGENRAFHGKPVESTWSHSGRYLWVPFYRRTFDINAQDPSAIAVVDTRTHSIVRMFETGPLPKMVATSPDSRLVAVTHWGDNTVGFIDVSSDSINRWHHLPPVTVGRKLDLRYPLDSAVNRDTNSGYLLRGTVFTPDGRYLLVSAMAGPMAVIDVEARRLTGQVPAIYGVRHLAIHGDNVYGSRNVAGTVLKFSLDSLLSGIKKAEVAGVRNITLGGGVATCKVGGGARTLDVSPDGKYLFVACNSGNAVYVVDAATMRVADTIRADSYPVGLALSADGRRMAVTSQGRKGYGGNAVNVYEVLRPDMPAIIDDCAETDTVSYEPIDIAPDVVEDAGNEGVSVMPYACAGAVVLAIIAAVVLRRIRKRGER